MRAKKLETALSSSVIIHTVTLQPQQIQMILTYTAHTCN